MRNQSLNIEKVIVPIVVLLLIGVFVLGYTYITTRPDVVQAAAVLAEKSALGTQAKGPMYDKLTRLLPEATKFSLALLTGGAMFLVGLAFAISVILHNTSRFLERGLEYTKEENGQKVHISLIQPNPVPQLASGGSRMPNIHVERPQPRMMEDPSPKREQLPSGNRPDHGNPQGAMLRKINPEERRSPGMQEQQKKALSHSDPLRGTGENVLGR